MNKEEAIKYLNEFILFKKISNTTEEEAIECFKLAIKALQQQPSEDEKVIRIKKGTLKARTGKYVIYDVEWLKTHFNTTEAKIYGQPTEHTEERTETHEGDCISRQAVLELLHKRFTDGFDNDKWWNSTAVLNAISEAPSVTPQPKTEPQAFHVMKGKWITQWNAAHQKEYYYCSECREEFSYDGETGIKMNDYKYCPDCGSYNGGTK